MEDKTVIASLFGGGDASEAAWQQFLAGYSKLILKILWQFEHQYDRVMDGYLAVCSKLAERNFAVLRKFHDDPRLHSADFPLWLAAVVRNISIDLYRAEKGRKRFPRALLNASQHEREVFALYYWRGYSFEEIRHQLHNRLNGKARDVAGILARIQRRLKRKPAGSASSITVIPFDDGHHQPEHQGGFPDAEQMDRWMNVLTPEQRLVVHLRFWGDMPATDIGRMLNIRPTHRIYGILQRAFATMRKKALEERRS